MRLIQQTIALAAVVISTQALAAMPEGNDVATTGELIELCNVSVDDPSYPAAMGYCLGYIDAVLDYHAALTAGPKYDPIVCPGSSLTRKEVVAVVLEWSKTNTQHLQSEAPVEGVMRALVEKWPCPGQ